MKNQFLDEDIPDYTIIDLIDRIKEKHKKRYFKPVQNVPYFANYFVIDEETENVE